ncbi:MAG TPA: ATP-binding protein, partial [Candidatus Dormibacteraeota bacterium]|nr:ATP-binding protein [Candidatus Dormibacteraeota bacterium]
MAAVLLVLGAFVYLRFHADLLAAVDAGLRSRAELLLSTATPGEGGGLVDRDEAFAQLLARNGAVLESSASVGGGPLLAADTVAVLEAATFSDAEVATDEEVISARLLAVPAADGTVLVVGASLEDQQDALGRLLTLLLIGGPVGVVLASGVGWLVAGGALRPVERLRIEAEAVSGSEPGRRLPVPATRDELARLGHSLNRMLGRLEDAVERERRFVGDASHELRTPLANLKAELELALRRARTSEELVKALRSAAEETDRLARLAEDLLVLARAQGGRLPVRREELDVGLLIRETIGGFTGRASELGISLAPMLEDGLRAEIDPARVRQAVGNLIENALRHTPSGGRVVVELSHRAGGISIEVADSGDGFEPSFLERAFDPFSRSDAARSRTDGGAGLGLAIVRAVAEGH